ncbi:hypothetical protein V8P55_17825, partial [Acinetobacter baumannii]
LIGNKAQKVTNRAEKPLPFGGGQVVTFNYDEGINVKKIQFALPSTLKGFGDGDFEVELSIDGQVYKKSVAAGSSLVEIALDNNTDKFLSGKDYSVKIYKRTSATTIELVMNSTNKITDKVALTYTGASYWSELPPMFYSKVGDLFEFEEQRVNQEGTLNNYSHLMMKNIPTGTSRVEVKYKVAGASQWSTLTSSAALYNNTAGWYTAGLNTLENNKLYDYQYLAYNAKGDILGGGQGGINTALNQATITQQALSATDLPSVYIDKQETVNTKQDVVKGVFTELQLISSKVNYFAAPLNVPVILNFSFNNSLLKSFSSAEFVLLIKNGDKVSKNQFSISLDSDVTSVDIMPPLRSLGDNNINLQLAVVEGSSFIEIGSGTGFFNFNIEGDYPARTVPAPYRIFKDYSGNITLQKSTKIYLTNQLSETTKLITYYRELGSNSAYIQLDAKPLMDVYGQAIAGGFDINFNSV